MEMDEIQIKGEFISHTIRGPQWILASIYSSQTGHGHNSAYRLGYKWATTMGNQHSILQVSSWPLSGSCFHIYMLSLFVSVSPQTLLCSICAAFYCCLFFSVCLIICEKSDHLSTGAIQVLYFFHVTTARDLLNSLVWITPQEPWQKCIFKFITFLFPSLACFSPDQEV